MKWFPALLFANDEIQANTGNFDEVAVIQFGWSRNGDAVHNRNFVAGADVIAVVALIDWRCHLRLEPAAKFDSSHCGFADGGEPVGQNIFLGVGPAGENNRSEEHTSELQSHSF